MPHYLIRASYTHQGIQGVMKEGAASRLRAVNDLVASVGGTLECGYWAFGDDDFIAIAELPDNSAAIAVAGTVGSSGAVTISTTVLLTAEDVDTGRARTVTYRPPGA